MLIPSYQALRSAGGQPALTDAAADWLARSTASGVILAEPFDDASRFVFTPGQINGLYPPNGSGPLKGFQDSSVKTSGASSLRFDVEGLTGDDCAGNYSVNFGQNFSQNSTFYVQYRQRFDSNMRDIDWSGLMGTSFKQCLFYDTNGLTCANIELTTVDNRLNSNTKGEPIIYSECGGRSVRTDIADLSHFTTAVPYYLQQGSSPTDGYNCEFDLESVIGSGNGVGCFQYPIDTWITFYYRIAVGTWGSANSSIEAWKAVGGGAYKQWTHCRDYTLFNDGNAGGGFSRIMLTPYMTGKNASVNHATAHTWYDELIVSTQPIAAPNN